MNAGFEQIVRDAVNDLADEGRSVNLSAAAVRQGRRLIVRRRVISAAAAFAAAAALAVPFVLANDRSRPIQPGAAPPAASAARSIPEATPVPSPTAPAPVQSQAAMPIGKGLLKLGGGLVLLAAPGPKGTWVYDRSRAMYKQIPYSRAYPAPSGELVAVTDAGRVGVYNMRTGTMRWVTGEPNVVGSIDWSEDGSRLVYPVSGSTTDTLRLGVVDMASLRLKVLGKDIECYENCAPAWLPGSKEITLADPSGRMVRGYSSFDGTPTGVLNLPGAIPARHSWSPNGTLVATRSAAETTIVEAQSGSPLLTLNERADCVYWISNSTLLVVRSDGFVTYALTGEVRGFNPMPTGVAEGELTATVVGQA